MAETMKIRTREEIPVVDTWALEDLYATNEAWERDLEEVDAQTNQLATYCGHLSDSADILYGYLSMMEQVNCKLELLANYCMRRCDEDTRNSVYQMMRGKFMNVYVRLNAACSFEIPEIMAISDEKLDTFYSDCDKLERYRRYLTDLRRRKAHTLSAVEEKLLAAAGEMAQTPDSVFGMFINADIKFQDAEDELGKKHPVTQGLFGVHQESKDRTLRKNAYEALYDSFTSFRNTAAALLDGQNKQLKFFAEARKYPNAFEAALDENDVPTAVYLNLIEAVHQNLDKMHRYVRLRKKLLNVPSLHFYDIYAPLVKDFDKEISFAQAKQDVYDGLAPLGEHYRKILQKGFENRWIDVYENEGKCNGAYSAGTTVHPFVLLNHKDNLDSEFTLAHEMGHALHSYLSYKNQNFVDANYTIFVAEVASTCNEALLMEYLLSKTDDPKERAYLINHFLEQFKGTIYRQTMFAEFELIIGRMTAQGQTLTADVLCAEYKKLNELYFGPDMVVDDRIAMEWARIPHFYYNYYVFQYATGYAAAIALSRRILREGEPAVRDYLRFLSSGCSASPIDLLKKAGVDMTTAEPVSQALELFDHLLDEMEGLVDR